MSILRYIEYFLARLLSSVKGHDKLLFTKQPVFKDIPNNIVVEAPEVGSFGSQLGVEYSTFGTSKFPELKWSLSPEASLGKDEVQEYILLCEDPDVPIPGMIGLHGLYYNIPWSKTHVDGTDVELDEDKSRGQAKWLKGGFRMGKTLSGKAYNGARPPVGHGGHRYFYQVIALKEKVNADRLSPVATKAELLKEINGKVLGWGSWYGTFENKW